MPFVASPMPFFSSRARGRLSSMVQLMAENPSFSFLRLVDHSIVLYLSIYAASEIVVTRCRLRRFTHPLSCHCVLCDSWTVHCLHRRAETFRTGTLPCRNHWSPSGVPHPCSPQWYKNGPRGDCRSLEVHLQHFHTLPEGMLISRHFRP
jgi:hypothetical protein